jgi:NAD(P)-dependent dehydrogenase (short-subunit alcohol dehydrogenase family)
MPDRAANVTGASRGIGFALADALGEEGYALTVSARKPDTLAQAAEGLRANGYEVEDVAANMADEDAIRAVVARPRDCFGRLDVLVNNAGVGIGAAAADHQTKFVDMQLDVNLRAIVLFYRRAVPDRRAARPAHLGHEQHNRRGVAQPRRGLRSSPWIFITVAVRAFTRLAVR